MQLVILGLLLGEALSLYDVRKRFTAGISLFYSASFGSIQRALTQLVESGAVTVAQVEADARGKKLYAVTAAGRERWRAEMLAPLSGGTDAETQALARIYLLGRLDSPADRTGVLELIRAHAETSLATLRTLEVQVDAAATGLTEDQHRVFGFQRATLDYGLRSHELLLRWVDELRERA